MTNENTCDIPKLQELLRSSKKNSGLTVKQIAETLNLSQTEVEHWFRTDDYFNPPDDSIWFKLKELIGITSDEFDAYITEFEVKDNVFEKANRCYDVNGKI